jgi:signal peptidase I
MALAVWRPARGDVVAFHHPSRPREVLLKRLVGLPGDRFAIQGHGTLRIEEGAAEGAASPDGLRKLGDDEYLVLGDRGDHSEDSRHFGPVPRDRILGKVWMRYWPADRVGPIPELPSEGDARKRLRTTGP